MRIVRVTVEAPLAQAWTRSTAVVEEVRAAAVPTDELAHTYADVRPSGIGVVIFLLVTQEEAAAVGCRLVLAAVDALGIPGARLGAIEVWNPAGAQGPRPAR